MVADTMVKDLLPFFKQRALRSSDDWQASAEVAQVRQLEAGKFGVDYRVTVTTRLEPRFRQELTGQFQVGPRAEVIYGGPEDWSLLYVLPDLSTPQATAFLRFVAESGNATVQNMTRLDQREAIASSFGAKYARELVRYAAPKGYRPAGLVFTMLGEDKFYLLGWDAARSRWMLLKTVPAEEVP